MMIFVSSSFVKLILVLVTLLSPPSSGRYLMSYAGNDFLNDFGDPSLIALNTPTLVQLKQMIDAQLAARAYLRCRTLFGPCPPPIPREQSLTVIDSVRIKVPAMEESAAADSKSPSGVDEATTTEDGDGIILWPSGNDQQRSNVPENETTESADCDEDNCGQEMDAGDGQLGQDFLQSQIESSSTTEEQGEVVSAEVEGTESATIVAEAAESTTISPELAESTTIAPELAESTTISPELAESTTIAPELAESTTIAPESAESTTIAPELAESSTIAPELAESTTIAPESAESTESTESTKTESAEQIAETTTLPSTTAAIVQPQSSEQPISASVPPSTTEEPTFSTSGQIGLVDDDDKDDEDIQIPLYDDTTQPPPPRLRDSAERRDAEKDEINPIFRSLGFSVMFEDLPPSPDFLRIAEERLKKATMA